ncbi:MAG: polyprenyl synthetase family protein [Nitrososphaerales archaeon]
MSYVEVLEKFGRLVETEVEVFLKSAIDEGHAYHPFIGSNYELIKEFVLRRGKRLASCSTLVAYKGYRDEIDKSIVRVACGIELYRHCILAHDDVVDQDEMRRGGETLHKTLERRYDDRFGLDSAIFFGNILYSLSLQAILSSGFEVDKLNRALELMASGFRDVNESQLLDLLFEYKFPDRNEWAVMASKRAASLFRVTILTGAMLAGVPRSELKLLNKATDHIGYAFDIQDDIIDTFAKEEQYGRGSCGDLIKGKKPLHVIIAMERSKSIKELLMKGHKDYSSSIELRNAIRDSGALDGAKEVSKKHAEKAKEGIKRSKMGEEAKDFFLSFIDYITESLEWYK